jgi:hypothetical protein
LEFLVLCLPSPLPPSFFLINEGKPRFFFWILLFFIALSAAAAVIYYHFKHDASTAISLGSYIVTCLALVLGLVAAGEYVGLQKPASGLNFDYNSKSGDFDFAEGEAMRDLHPGEKERLGRSIGREEKRREEGA